MKAKVTRTLQAPQYAPITITLSKECTAETFDATMDELADAVERKLRERYPRYANVLPEVPKNDKPVIKQQFPVHPAKVFTDKIINIHRGAALIKVINDCTSLSQLEQYESQLDSTEAEIVYDEKKRQFQHKKVS